MWGSLGAPPHASSLSRKIFKPVSTAIHASHIRFVNAVQGYQEQLVALLGTFDDGFERSKFLRAFMHDKYCHIRRLNQNIRRRKDFGYP